MIGLRIPVLVWLIALPLCVVPLAVVSARAAMSVSLQPDTAYVQPAEAFTLDLTVDHSDSLFNSYEAVLQWDPVELLYVDAQAGPLMPPDFWFEVVAGPDSVRIRHAITYGVYGPGVVAQLTLRALGTAASQVTFRRAVFSYGGQHYYHPALRGATVIVLDPTSDAGDSMRRDVPYLRVVPNPATVGSRIVTRVPDGGPLAVALFDPSGRLMLHRELSAIGRGSCGTGIEMSSLLGGRVLPSGVYGIVVSGKRSRVSSRFVIVR